VAQLDKLVRDSPFNLGQNHVVRVVTTTKQGYCIAFL
jgi:hypothetical protein